jgi:secernin
VCDTFVALPDAPIDGSVIFGKNSDRPEGEIQDVVTFPAQTHLQGQPIQCTHYCIYIAPTLRFPR